MAHAFQDKGLPMDEQEVQIKFGENQATIKFSDPQTFFRILKSLKENGHDPQFRYHDEELRDWTCWQPSSIVK